MDKLLDGMRLQADPVADRVMGRIVAENGPEDAKRVFSALIRNVEMPFPELPDYVREYMEVNGVVPADIDAEKVVRGQKVFIDYGIYFVLFLYVKALPTCYLDWKGAEVLHQTGRLQKGRGYPEIFARRIAETAQFILDVMVPGSLAQGGKGIETTLKIRMVHASIRHFIGRSPAYNEEEWGKPINQEDMALTLMTFSVTMIEAMEQLGEPLSEQEADDYCYAWNLIGRILGVDEKLIPKDVSEGKQLLKQILARVAGSSEAGAALTQALVDFAVEMTPGKSAEKSMIAQIRFFMGPEHADMLGVKGGAGCWGFIMPRILAKAIGLSERLEDKGEPLARLVNQLGLGLIRGMVKRMDNYKNRHFQVPSVMEEAWGVVSTREAE